MVLFDIYLSSKGWLCRTVGSFLVKFIMLMLEREWGILKKLIWIHTVTSVFQNLNIGVCFRFNFIMKCLILIVFYICLVQDLWLSRIWITKAVSLCYSLIFLVKKVYASIRIEICSFFWRGNGTVLVWRQPLLGNGFYLMVNGGAVVLYFLAYRMILFLEGRYFNKPLWIK